MFILAATALAASAGEAPKPPEPPKIVAPTAEEIKAELAKETPAQQALRAELSALAKAGQKIYFNANLGANGQNDRTKPSSGEKDLPLSWDRGSVNYYPDFSPDGKYLAYSHSEIAKGLESWTIKTKQELYVTRFPKCEATVRITWNGAANYHPHWWGPAAK